MLKYIRENKADSIGWIGTAGFMIGSVLLAYKSPLGFTANIIANGCYLFQGKWAKLPSLITISIVLIVLNVFALYKWMV